MGTCLAGKVGLSIAESLGVQHPFINARGDPTKGPRKDAYEDFLLSWLTLHPRCTRLGTGEWLVLQEEVNAVLAEKNYHARNSGADGSGTFPTARRTIDNSRAQPSSIGVVMCQ